MKTPKFDYSNTELYTSKYSIYGYCLFIMIDIENKTFVFGQSKSDRDTLQFLFDYFETGYSAKYRPSVDEFSVTADFGTGELETQTK